jgi:hypothetical protein
LAKCEPGVTYNEVIRKLGTQITQLGLPAKKVQQTTQPIGPANDPANDQANYPANGTANGQANGLAI